MYEEFYGFRARPFQLTPDHRFFFESSVHGKAVSYLLYGLSQGEGFIVITGEVGAGKTTLLKHLLSTLDPAQYVAAEIVTSQLSAEDVLTMVALAWGLSVPSNDKTTVLSAIERFFKSNHQQNRRCLLLVDEAQNLPVAALEELRMLSNFQIEGRSPLQSFLIGQPQFRRVLSSQNLEQLRQRVIASYHLGPMSEAETAEYVRHRLSRVGWSGDPDFTDECMRAIYRHTSGVPRRINSLASRLLLFGVLDQVHGFTARVVDMVAEEMRYETEQVPSSALQVGACEAAGASDVLGRIEKLEAFCARVERKTKLGLQLLAEYLANSHG
jgi:putative secretion ATPase (PEP-CTERM system associated)